MRVACVLVCCLALAGCAGTTGLMYAPIGPVTELDVSLEGVGWDGETIPRSGICADGQGRGMSPTIRVKGIPPEADAVVVEFNDKGYHELSEYGGHGAIWVATNGAAEVVVPPVHELTFDLPDGVHMEHAHRAQGFGPGAYLAPCSLGWGHLYEAHIMAVRKKAPDGPELLSEATLPMGIY